MKKPILSVLLSLLTVGLLWIPLGHAHAEPSSSQAAPAKATQEAKNRSDKVVKTEEEWKKSLTPEQFRILRQQGTERAFTGAYWDNHEKGVYKCAGCGQVLFRSDEKFDSGTGWPSYWQPADPKAVETTVDRSMFMTRTEVHCSKCGGHLGHIFEDGPRPTGLRYCINSASLTFEKK